MDKLNNTLPFFTILSNSKSTWWGTYDTDYNEKYQTLLKQFHIVMSNEAKSRGLKLSREAKLYAIGRMTGRAMSSSRQMLLAELYAFRQTVLRNRDSDPTRIAVLNQYFAYVKEFNHGDESS